MAYVDFRDYQEEQILIEYDVIKHLILLNQSPKYDGYKRGLFLIVYKFFDEKPATRADRYANTTATLADIAIDGPIKVMLCQTNNFQTKYNKHFKVRLFFRDKI